MNYYVVYCYFTIAHIPGDWEFQLGVSRILFDLRPLGVILQDRNPLPRILSKGYSNFWFSPSLALRFAVLIFLLLSFVAFAGIFFLRVNLIDRGGLVDVPPWIWR